jgi:hypothetical protein
LVPALRRSGLRRSVNGVDGTTHAPLLQLPKQWKWKSVYHSFEHALVGYIVAQQLRGELVTLYDRFRAIPRRRLCNRITIQAR